MAVTLSFSGFCEQLGVPLYNKAWSWCSSSPDKQIALFTVWEDRIKDGLYNFTTKPRSVETRKKPGRTELIRTLDEVINLGFAAYAIKCRAKDVEANPRVRWSFETRSLLDLRISRVGDGYVGRIVGTVPANAVLQRAINSNWNANSAINDIEQDGIGNTDPEYRKRMAGSYVRDSRVRNDVLARANGACEFCGETGFPKMDGMAYLETHHVISLSEQGADTVTNVIALCANHHRQAHFGEIWISLQNKFLEILKKKKR